MVRRWDRMRNGLWSRSATTVMIRCVRRRCSGLSPLMGQVAQAYAAGAGISRHEPRSISMTNFLTSQEMQDLINVDRSTVYRMAEDGRLPAVKVGRQWRFPADRVAAQFGLSEPTVAAARRPVRRRATSRPRRSRPAAPTGGRTIDRRPHRRALRRDGRDHRHGRRPVTPVANPCGYYATIARPAGRRRGVPHRNGGCSPRSRTSRRVGFAPTSASCAHARSSGSTSTRSG